MAHRDQIETPPRARPVDAKRIDHLQRIANVMDSAVRIPGTRLRIGLDSIVGLIPAIGDTAAMLPAAYIIGSAWRMGLPRRDLARMVGNSAIDTLIGSVPLLGDIFDVGFKANLKNMAILQDHLATPPK